jgi:hypothetical protein
MDQRSPLIGGVPYSLCSTYDLQDPSDLQKLEKLLEKRAQD